MQLTAPSARFGNNELCLRLTKSAGQQDLGLIGSQRLLLGDAEPLGEDLVEPDAHQGGVDTR